MMEVNLKPVKRQFDGHYVSLSLENLKANLQNVIARKGEYFSDAPDTVAWELMKKDGKLAGEKGIDEITTVFDLYDENTVQLRLDIFYKKVTRNFGWPLIPEEYVTLRLDFSGKGFFFAASVVGEANSYALLESITAGINLIGVKLPTEHQYLEKFLRRFYEDHPVYERNVFLIIRFQQQPPFPIIVEVIRNECAKWNLNVLRADDKEYTDDLWNNVLTYLYGCKCAIAVFDQINYREFNPNVSLEVGFLFAQCKRVLLLKDEAIPVMPTDIVGKIYRPFNTYDSQVTIPPQIEKWVTDYQIGQ